MSSLEISKKLRRIFAITALISFAIMLAVYKSGCFSKTVTPAQIAQQQALEYYSRTHKMQHSRPARSLFQPRVNAVIVILCRNDDLESLLGTLRNFETQFNKQFVYPYVFLNNVPFYHTFKKQVTKTIRSYSGAKVEFGLIPAEHWSYPPWVNQTLAAEKRIEMAKNNVIYGGSESYRHMCRYFSGFIHDHPLLKPYDYYWRVEPGVRYFCKIPFDPFFVLAQGKKKYGFVISFGELPDTIPSLWNTTMQFTVDHPELQKPSTRCLDYFINQHDQYNHCHFWSNFEIASFQFFRSSEYRAYFSYLDKKGGFFYERWGDAPVHSLAIGLFLSHEDVVYFEDIGYQHMPFSHCPIDAGWRREQNCQCNPFHEHDQTHSECQRRWRHFWGETI